MLPNGGESITLMFGRLEDFPEAWRPRVIFSTKTWRPTFWCTAMIFHSGPTGGAKVCTEFAARCIRAEKSCDSGPRLVAVTDSEFLGQNTDVVKVENRVRARPAACFLRLELKALGLTDAKGVATPGTDDVGGNKASEISEWRRTAKWHDPLEEVREEDDLVTGEELKLFQSLALSRGRVRIGSGGESSNRRCGTAANFERLLDAASRATARDE